MVKSFYSVLLKKCIVQGQKIYIYFWFCCTCSVWTITGSWSGGECCPGAVSGSRSPCLWPAACAQTVPSASRPLSPQSSRQARSRPASHLKTQSITSCQVSWQVTVPQREMKNLSALQDRTSILFHHYLRESKSSHFTLLLNCSPSQIIGSIVNTWPGFMTPTALFSAIK